MEEACKYIVDVDFSGDDVVFIGVNDQEDKIRHTLYLASVDTGKVYRSGALDDPQIEGFSGVRFNADGTVTAYLEYENKCLSFDRELKQIGGVREYRAPDYMEEAKKNLFFDGTMSTHENCFHYFSDFNHYELVNALGFYDDADRIYLAKNERVNVLSGSGKRVLTSYPSDGMINKDTVSVYDFETDVIINSFETPNPENRVSVTVTTGKLAENAAFIGIEYGDGDPAGGEYYNKYFIWNYNENAQNKSFEAVSYTAGELREANEKKCEAIKDAYETDVFIDRENEYQSKDDEVYGYTFGASPLKVKISLDMLDTFLKKLPQGFTREIYQGFNENVKEFCIYFVNDIKGSPNAYADTYSDRFYICFETYTLTPNTIYHEFMHVIEARIRECFYSEGRDLDEEWNRLNPPDFEYYSTSDYEFSDYTDYFATAYSMENGGEDRADMFMDLFSSALDGELPYWYQEGKPVAEKAKLLVRSISQAYPSMVNADHPLLRDLLQ